MLIFYYFRRIIRLQENKRGKTVFRGEPPMKILRITAQGLPLFKENLEICFYALELTHQAIHRCLRSLVWQ